jgi:acyl phosphate:glycerol-3-phosphate acyltransferase
MLTALFAAVFVGWHSAIYQGLAGLDGILTPAPSSQFHKASGAFLPSKLPAVNPAVVLGALVVSYLIGSVDFAVIVARLHGVDIHEVGSGNPGTSNVMRTLGRGPAAMVFVGDTLKGVIAAAIGAFLVADADPLSPWAFMTGLAAVAGHCYPLYHNFKGGKGVATGGGVLAFCIPVVALILTVIWALVAKVGKVASVASLVVVVLTLPLAYWQGVRWPALGVLVAMLALVTIRHRGNISRIVRRAEQKVVS